jgi:hypothetical protein
MAVNAADAQSDGKNVSLTFLKLLVGMKSMTSETFMLWLSAGYVPIRQQWMF